MAMRMFQSGCVSCARSYLEVARAYGADEGQLEQIEDWLAPEPAPEGDAGRFE